MKKLRQERLVKYARDLGEVVVLVKDCDGGLRKRLISTGDLIKWCGHIFGPFNEHTSTSCFERKSNGDHYQPSLKRSIARMYKHDGHAHYPLTIIAVLSLDGDTIWGAK